MKIGVFGGEFDPPHVGHLVVAQEARHALGLDWLELFRRAYLGPVPPAEVPAAAGIDELEMRVLDILHRHGVLPDVAPEDSGSTARAEPDRSAGPDAREAAPGTAVPVRSWPR